MEQERQEEGPERESREGTGSKHVIENKTKVQGSNGRQLCRGCTGELSD